jgi:hypothetical protein
MARATLLDSQNTTTEILTAPSPPPVSLFVCCYQWFMVWFSLRWVTAWNERRIIRPCNLVQLVMEWEQFRRKLLMLLWAVHHCSFK